MYSPGLCSRMAGSTAWKTSHWASVLRISTVSVKSLQPEGGRERRASLLWLCCLILPRPSALGSHLSLPDFPFTLLAPSPWLSLHLNPDPLPFPSPSTPSLLQSPGPVTLFALLMYIPLLCFFNIGLRRQDQSLVDQKKLQNSTLKAFLSIS